MPRYWQLCSKAGQLNKYDNAPHIIIKDTWVCCHVFSCWHSRGRGFCFHMYQEEHSCIWHSKYHKLLNIGHGEKLLCIFLHMLPCSLGSAEGSCSSYFLAAQLLMKLQSQQVLHTSEEQIPSWLDIRRRNCLQKPWEPLTPKWSLYTLKNNYSVTRL